MANPSEVKSAPISKGYRFVRKANMWCGYIHFDKGSSKIQYFNTKEEAKKFAYS